MMRRLIFITLYILTSTTTIFAETKGSIALIQSTFVWGDVEANMASFEKKILSIKECSLIILPELFTSGCDMQKRERESKIAAKRGVAYKYTDIVTTMQRWAKETNAVIVGSTIYEENNLFYNRLLAVYPSGEYLHYDKHNCFKMGGFAAGTEHLVIEIGGDRFATYICYDLRFPEWSRNDNRYDTAIYIANWPTSRSDDWSTLLRERAIENRAHVIGVNCVGTDLGGVTYMGDSSIYAPDGSLVAACKSN
ncbi:MAG: nitrilase-related carbon-nitrogen hydrolase, partial [Rikenellaceae bacterium]